VAGCAHGDRERVAVHPDLERLFDGDRITPAIVLDRGGEEALVGLGHRLAAA
jgi:hypothetical protein